MTNIRPALLRHSFLAACLMLLIIPVAAQQIQTDPQVSYESKHDVSLHSATWHESPQSLNMASSK